MAGEVEMRTLVDRLWQAPRARRGRHVQDWHHRQDAPSRV